MWISLGSVWIKIHTMPGFPNGTAPGFFALNPRLHSSPAVNRQTGDFPYGIKAHQKRARLLFCGAKSAEKSGTKNAYKIPITSQIEWTHRA
ncbi:hypothetical protein [Duganella lactea]|uniref:hypothetical protein n=1 Tax=Duganella lactea TaxID=2692173 RepID=UPI0019286DED|nr:hypothetical protein [Duganella lactea]